MKFALALLAISSLATLAAFGFFVMKGHEGGQMHECLAALGAVSEEACPPSSNIAGFLQFHFGAFQTYSTAILALSLFSLVFIAFRLSWDPLKRHDPAFAPLQLSQLGRIYALAGVTARADLLSWLAQLENRDPVAA